MKISKKLLVLSLSIVTLSACGNESSNTTAKKETEENQVVENKVNKDQESEVTDSTSEEESNNEEKENQEIEKDKEKDSKTEKETETGKEKDSKTEKETETDKEKEEKVDDKSEEEDVDDTNLDKKALFEEFKTENKKVINVLMESELTSSQGGQTSKSTFDAEAEYDENQALIIANTEAESDDGYKQKIIFDPNDPTKAQIVERQAGEEETTVTEAYDITDFSLNPDYHGLVDSIIDLEDDLEVEEKSDVYLLKLKNPDADVIKIVGEQYNVELGEVSKDDIEQYLEIEIEKDSKLLKSFLLELEASAEGHEGSKVKTQTKLSNHELAK